MAWGHVKEVMVSLLAALGILAEPSQFYGGLFLSVSGGYLASIWMPENEKKEIRLVIITAVIISTLMAVLHPFIFTEFPLQLTMGFAGFLSRYVVLVVLRAASRVVSQTDTIADSAISRVFGKRPSKDRDK